MERMLAALVTASKETRVFFAVHGLFTRLQSVDWRANPDEETTDWRAVCGRTARTVRRAGTARAVSDPYQDGDGGISKLKTGFPLARE
jgi:hypothetical protein